MNESTILKLNKYFIIVQFHEKPIQFSTKSYQIMIDKCKRRRDLEINKKKKNKTDDLHLGVAEGGREKEQSKLQKNKRETSKSHTRFNCRITKS